MNGKAITWAFDQNLPATEKLALAWMASMCDERNRVHHIRIADIAKVLCCPFTSAHRALERLVDQGFVSLSGDTIILNAPGRPE